MIKVNIKQTAIKKGIRTAYQLQKLMNLQPSVASRLFNNKLTMISFGTLERLCDALECEPADLITYTASKPRAEKPAREPQTTKAAGTDKAMMTTFEVAEELGLSRKRVNDYINLGQLKATKGKQRHNLVDRSDFEEFRKTYQSNQS